MYKTNVTFGKIPLVVALITLYMVVFAQGAAMLDLKDYFTGTIGMIPVTPYPLLQLYKTPYGV